MEGVKVAVGQILYIPSGRSWTPICRFLRGPRGRGPSKGGIELAKTRRRTPPTLCRWARLWRIAFNSDGLRTAVGCSDRRRSFYELLARARNLSGCHLTILHVGSLLASVERGTNQETASNKRVETLFPSCLFRWVSSVLRCLGNTWCFR